MSENEFGRVYSGSDLNLSAAIRDAYAASKKRSQIKIQAPNIIKADYANEKLIEYYLKMYNQIATDFYSEIV